MNRLLGTRQWLAIALAGVVALLAAGDAMAADNRELKAREAFAAQRYQDALDLFAKLYAETLHPIYLRNIGRCYQNLGDPDRAITSFREYLRKAKSPTADETREIEGFIWEMEELKRRKEASASASTPPPTTGSDTSEVKPLPSAVPPPTGGGTGPEAVLTAPPPKPAEESPPIYGRWWFWAIVGGVVLAGVGGLAAAGVFTSTQDASCPGDRMCMP